MNGPAPLVQVRQLPPAARRKRNRNGLVMNKAAKIIIALAVMVGVIRPFMPQRHGFTVEMTFEAVDHIVVGMLIAGWILAERKKPYWISLFVITGIEIICAMRH